jgi:hypothetical protein
VAFRVVRRATVPNPSGSIVSIENDGPGILKGTWDAMGGRSYTSKLKVITSSAYVGTIQVILSLGFKYGAYYRWPLPEYNGTFILPLLPVEQDTGSFLQSIAAEQSSEDGREWTITLEYTPRDVETELGQQDEDGVIDPTTKKPDVSWESAKYERSKPEDESDPKKPYINTVGDPIEDVPPTEEGRPILTIVRNEWTYDETWIQKYGDHVNSTPFLGYAPNVVKCKDINAKMIRDPDWDFYWEVTYQFEFRDDEEGNGWDTRLLNEGYRRLDFSGNKQVIMISGAPASSPQLLSQGGDVLAAGTAPYFLTFKQFKSVDFTALNIPDDLLTGGTT